MKNRIKELRLKTGLTLRALGEKVGLANSTLSQYETGKREPRFETWQKLANYFGVSVPSLMGLDEITTNKIYMFQGNHLGDYSFAVLATSETEAWELIKDRIASNKNQFLDDEFANDIRKYSISSIDLNDAAPQVIEDWKR
jgi:transcriptional regulator with XRE-family HTH domain